jgi:putative chitinase
MSVKSLQEKIGVKADGVFGPTTLKAAMRFFKMTPERAAHFFGQTGHETGEFKVFSENLNYSAAGLKKTFGKYFPENLSESYARNPEKIANRVYGNRLGNGSEITGDGFKFRGRGAIQLTGKSNYQAFATYIKVQAIMENPDLVATSYSFESAFYFFDKNKLWSICDKGVNNSSIKELTLKINGGYNGLDHREELTKKYYQWLQ